MGSHLAVYVGVRRHEGAHGVEGAGAAVAVEAALVVHVVLDGHLLGLVDRTAAPRATLLVVLGRDDGRVRVDLGSLIRVDLLVAVLRGKRRYTYRTSPM